MRSRWRGKLRRLLLGRWPLGVVAVLLTVATGPVAGDRLAGAQQEPPFAFVYLIDEDGRVIGEAQLFAGRDGVVVSLLVEGLRPGFHGLHVHTVGRCVPPFASAGGHLDPDDRRHGHHAGDLPPLRVAADGVGIAEFETGGFTLAELLAGDGSALVVHRAADNLAHIPDRYQSGDSTTPGPDAVTRANGDSGARAACGVIQAQENLGAFSASSPRAEELRGALRGLHRRRAGAQAMPALAQVVDRSGRALGQVGMVPLSGSTLVIAVLDGLVPGFHGFHLHQRGRCEPPFTSAGDHVGAGTGDHGGHAGDLPPQLVGPSGRATMLFDTDAITVADALAGDGTAVVVHATPDNLAHVPDRYQSTDATGPGPDEATLADGDSGARTGCGTVGRFDPDRQYVGAVYADLLGRTPDAAGSSHWAGFLREGGRRLTFTGAISRSPEHLRAVVRQAYLRYLGRAADRGGLELFVGALAAGATLEHVETALLGSDEYLGGVDAEGFVRKLYRDLLDRLPLDRERRYWQQQLDGGASRAAVAAAVLRGTEASGRRVREAYRLLLDRRPDAAGAGHWTAYLAGGGDRLGMLAVLAASPEYVAKALGPVGTYLDFLINPPFVDSG